LSWLLVPFKLFPIVSSSLCLEILPPPPESYHYALGE
jgi:hypothetical protein